jgi:hypothetical protein
MPCIPQSTRRSIKRPRSAQVEGWQELRTKGTPAKFQKMTIKPHLKNDNQINERNNYYLLLVIHIPRLGDTLFALRAENEIRKVSSKL